MSPTEQSLRISPLFATIMRAAFVVRIGLLTLATLAVVPLANAQYTATLLYDLGRLTPHWATGGQVVGDFLVDGPGFHGHAGLRTSGGLLVDLHPNGFDDSVANGTDGTQQVGTGSVRGGNSHAYLWTGTAASAVDLNPSMFASSQALGTKNGQQVGIGGGHAVLWSGTAASAVDLNPVGFTGSLARGTDGVHQVGDGIPGQGAPPWHALLWSGTADSAVDLHPSGFYSSHAYGTGGTQQVGSGYLTSSSDDQALLWTGTAASVVKLNPSGYLGSRAYATNGTQQVGLAYFPVSLTPPTVAFHAFLWSGTADSGVDLHQLLPATGVWDQSEAFDIDSSGNIFGYALGTYNNVRDEYAIEWSPVAVPEPASAMLLLIGTATIFALRKSQHRS